MIALNYPAELEKFRGFWLIPPSSGKLWKCAVTFTNVWLMPRTGQSQQLIEPCR
jgi:hypothetical protein